MLAALVFQMEYFFLGKDNKYQLVEIVNFFGTKDFYDYLNKYKIKLEPEMYVLFKRVNSRKLESMINQQNKHLVTPEAIDLI